MEKLSNTETELKKSVAYKKNVYSSLVLLLLLLLLFVLFFLLSWNSEKDRGHSLRLFC